MYNGVWMRYGYLMNATATIFIPGIGNGGPISGTDWMIVGIIALVGILIVAGLVALIVRSTRR